MIPYAKHQIHEKDIAAVVFALSEPFITTGPEVEKFERAFCEFTGAEYAVAVNSGTAALHAAMFSLDVRIPDEVIIPALSFVASANCVVYQGGWPIFADVEKDTLCIDPFHVEKLITFRTKAIVAMDYGGLPCNYTALLDLSAETGIPIICDACHSLGAKYSGIPVGLLGAISCFSFHPAKVMTTGEGGMAVTDDEKLADRMRRFRNHGIDKARGERAGYHYNMVDLGYNYRLSDIQCAMGRSQLKRVAAQVARRQEIAAMYDEVFATHPKIATLAGRESCTSAHHLYVVQVPERDRVYARMREAGIGVNVHYKPIYQHPYYQHNFGEFAPCPVAEAAYQRLLTLPCYLGLTDDRVQFVIDTLKEIVNGL